MKKLLALFLSILFLFAACSTKSSGALSASGANSNLSDHKILVAYFSATGNTERIAQKLANGLGADLYKITPQQPYTSSDLNYGNSQSRSTLEMNDPSARPAISGTISNIDQYDLIFIGYPIWWGQAPRIISTFVESYDLSGKTLVAFCTSGVVASVKAMQPCARPLRTLLGLPVTAFQVTPHPPISFLGPTP